MHKVYFSVPLTSSLPFATLEEYIFGRLPTSVTSEDFQIFVAVWSYSFRIRLMVSAALSARTYSAKMLYFILPRFCAVF